jgi:hypothetical protein
MDNKLSHEEYRNIVVEHLTLRWLVQAGLDPEDPNTPPVELDESDETSQITAWKLTAEEAYDYMLEALQKIEDSGYELELEDDPVADYVQDNFGGGYTNHDEGIENHPSSHKPRGPVSKSSTVYFSMRTDPGVPTYLGDVREWLAEVDSLGVPDSAEVEGELFLSIDTALITSERSECLYCGNKEDILLTVHDCEAGLEEV